MSQSQDMAAINDQIMRTTATNAAAVALQNTWFQWYNALATFERDYDTETLADAKARRDAFNRAMAQGAVSAPGPTPVVLPVPRATIKKGSKDPAGVDGPVHEWQRIVGAKPVDGIFGSGTEGLTKTWQKAHGLVNDGIVGPLTWAQAVANSAAAAVVPAPIAAATVQAIQAVIATNPKPAPVIKVEQVAEAVANQIAVAVATPAKAKADAVKVAAVVAAAAIAPETPIMSTTFPVLREGSKGDAVKTWQTTIGVSPADGVFGPDTAQKTRTWQASRGLVADGIVGPATWTAATMPGAGSAVLATDVVAASFDRATGAVKGAFMDLHTMTPTWLKALGAGLAGWSALLAFSALRKKS